MLKDVSDHRYAQLAEALKSYGFVLDEDHYLLREYVLATPDKFFYFFTDKDKPNEVLVLLVEDYISGLDYVKDCFNRELDTRSAALHKIVASKDSAKFEERRPVKVATTYRPPDDWDGLQPYAMDFPPFYFGFLATVIPKSPKEFWNELHERLEQF